jgi:hypothetical protein
VFRLAKDGDGADSVVIVDTPKWSDAFAPSLSVAAAIGSHQVPLVVGPFAQHAVGRNEWQVGLGIGMHVPLFDLN